MTNKQSPRRRQLSPQPQATIAPVRRSPSQIESKKPCLRTLSQLDEKRQDTVAIVQQGQPDGAGAWCMMGQQTGDDVGDVHHFLFLSSAMYVQDANIVIVDVAQRTRVVEESGAVGDDGG